MSDREITADLMARLRRHYIKPGEQLPSGVFLPEIGWNGSSNSCRCDALYVGFTSTSGRQLVGHEVKASRSDWLTELGKLNKADGWADQCHQWWLVTVPGVVRDGELPAGWGLMLPGTSKTRMKIETKAQAHTDRTPSWDATRSIVARLNTLHRTGLKAQIDAAKATLNADFEARVEESAKWRHKNVNTSDELQASVDRIHAALGGQVAKWGHGDNFTEDELRLAGDWIRTRRNLRTATSRLSQPHALKQMRTELEAAVVALAALAELETKLRTATDLLGRTA